MLKWFDKFVGLTQLRGLLDKVEVENLKYKHEIQNLHSRVHAADKTAHEAAAQARAARGYAASIVPHELAEQIQGAVEGNEYFYYLKDPKVRQDVSAIYQEDQPVAVGRVELHHFSVQINVPQDLKAPIETVIDAVIRNDIRPFLIKELAKGCRQ